jgi:hypothetical protein
MGFNFVQTTFFVFLPFCAPSASELVNIFKNFRRFLIPIFTCYYKKCLAHFFQTLKLNVQKKAQEQQKFSSCHPFRALGFNFLKKVYIVVPKNPGIRYLSPMKKKKQLF